jgi:hypothetical protein
VLKTGLWPEVAILYIPGLGTRMLFPGFARTEMQRSMEDEQPLQRITSSPLILEGTNVIYVFW